VTIRPLKRFVTDRFGPETGDYTLYREANNDGMLPPNRGDYERVAVIGAGVSGLTAAHDLVKIGYKVTVFEAENDAGGMLTAGVPVFRLPRELVRHEIAAILSLGVELKCNQRLGRDFTIASLRRDGFKAIFLGIDVYKRQVEDRLDSRPCPHGSAGRVFVLRHSGHVLRGAAHVEHQAA